MYVYICTQTCTCTCTHSLLVNANKLKTARIAGLPGPTLYFFHEYTMSMYMYMCMYEHDYIVYMCARTCNKVTLGIHATCTCMYACSRLVCYTLLPPPPLLQHPYDTPKFDHYSNNLWPKRHRARQAFIRAARRVLIQVRRPLQYTQYMYSTCTCYCAHLYMDLFTNDVLNTAQVRVRKKLEKIRRLVENVKNGMADEVHAPGTMYIVYTCTCTYIHSGIGTGGARGAGAPPTFWHLTTPTHDMRTW